MNDWWPKEYPSSLKNWFSFFKSGFDFDSRLENYENTLNPWPTTGEDEEKVHLHPSGQWYSDSKHVPGLPENPQAIIIFKR